MTRAGTDLGVIMNFHSPDAQPTKELRLHPKHCVPMPVEVPDAVVNDCNLEEFGELVASYQDRLYHSVLRLVGNAEDARDVVQETFLRAYQFRHTFQAESLFFTWLYRIAVNTIITMKRKHRRYRGLHTTQTNGLPLDPPDATRVSQPEHALAIAEEERKVQIALGQLSLEHREVLVMKDMEGMRYEAIAEVLGLPVGTIRSRLHRARLKLRSILVVSEER
ncbi:MAG TPA: sigma-70 family RNA polymerase sigma factor [Gemmataceae bacterium]|nr:sigma-70 family RNA polymerase sigma factor [Gemmataceae bacterium]